MITFCNQRELDQWKKENQSLQLQLKKEESVTAQTLQPLVATLEVRDKYVFCKIFKHINYEGVDNCRQ